MHRILIRTPQLYDEITSELRDLKVEVIQHWLSDGVKLSGGAGRKIVSLRANAFGKALAEHLTISLDTLLSGGS
jgi:hypothetical protein